MRYLVTARVKPGQARALAQAIEDGTLGAGSIAGDEYVRNMECAAWACSDCDCTDKLEQRLESWGASFVKTL